MAEINHHWRKPSIYLFESQWTQNKTRTWIWAKFVIGFRFIRYWSISSQLLAKRCMYGLVCEMNFLDWRSVKLWMSYDNPEKHCPINFRAAIKRTLSLRTINEPNINPISHLPYDIRIAIHYSRWNGIQSIENFQYNHLDDTCFRYRHILHIRISYIRKSLFFYIIQFLQ